MRTEDILSTPSTVLTQTQREFFFEQGYLAFPDLIKAVQLDVLRQTMHTSIGLSRDITASNQQFDLEEGHCASDPRLRRVAYVDDIDSRCWEFCANSVVTDIARDILGPNVRFRDAFINFKWANAALGLNGIRTSRFILTPIPILASSCLHWTRLKQNRALFRSFPKAIEVPFIIIMIKIPCGRGPFVKKI